MAKNTALASELIVGFYKVGSGRAIMSWSESVDEALCFGWIDGVRKRIDGNSYLIRFTPRKTTSIWSAVNIAKVKNLQAKGRMTPAGATAFVLRIMEKSVVYAYEQHDAHTLSPEEERKFKRDKAAWRYWETCPLGYRKLALHRIVTAKKAETRTARLAKLISSCAAGQRWQ